MGLVTEAEAIVKQKEEEKAAALKIEKEKVERKNNAEARKRFKEEEELSKPLWDWLAKRFNYTEKERVGKDDKLSQEEKLKSKLGFSNLLPFWDLGLYVYVSDGQIRVSTRCYCGKYLDGTSLYTNEYYSIPTEKEVEDFLVSVAIVRKRTPNQCDYCYEEHRRRCCQD